MTRKSEADAKAKASAGYFSGWFGAAAVDKSSYLLTVNRGVAVVFPCVAQVLS
jgi:hypothetical protein